MTNGVLIHVYTTATAAITFCSTIHYLFSAVVFATLTPIKLHHVEQESGVLLPVCPLIPPVLMIRANKYDASLTPHTPTATLSRSGRTAPLLKEPDFL